MRVAVVVFTAIALLTYLGFTKKLPFGSPWTLKATFTNGTQLRSGSPVRIGGVDVGKVTRVQQGPGSGALVSMTIKPSGQPIHADATLSIRPRLFLEGGFYVQLEPGSPSAARVSSGYTVPLAQTRVPVQFFTAISTLDRPLRSALARALHETSAGLAGGGARGLHSSLGHLGPALRDTALVVQAAQGRPPEDVRALVSGAERVTRALAVHDAQLGGAIDNAARVSSTVAAQDAALARSVPALDQLLIAAPPALSALDRALPTLSRFAGELRPALRAAPPVLDRASSTLAQLRAVSRPAELPALLTGLTPFLHDLPALNDRLQVLFPRVTPVARCLSTIVLPALTTKLNDGALSTGRPVWQDVAHGFTNIASVAQSFDANGFFLRYNSTGQQQVSLGSIPGVGQMIGSATAAILGSRPQVPPPGGAPAFRPDQECTAQAPPNLQAPAAPALERTRPAPDAGSLKLPGLRRLIGQLRPRRPR